jgi:hypothetical protein
MTSEIKNCQNCKKEFTIEPDDFGFYEKIKVPPPTFCPECRAIRRFLWRNENCLYKRNCGLCGKKVISVYPESTVFPVYCHECWWSDKWDAQSYQSKVDFEKSFLLQWKNLSERVPKYSLYNVNAVRSDYCNICMNTKDSYLVFGSGFNENCMYGNTLFKCKEVIESLWTKKSENSAYLIDCESCYGTLFAQDSGSCIDSMFIYDCHNCQDCILSTNLRDKQFYIRNIRLSKEEYIKEKKAIIKSIGSHKKFVQILADFNEIKTKALRKFMIGKNHINSTGNFIYNAKNARNCFFVSDIENLKHSVKSVEGQKDSMDIFGVSVGGELMYDSLNVDYASRGKCILHGDHIIDSAYLLDCHNSSNCFACIGLRNKSYCILNKQYSKEEYEALVPKIIQHMNDMPYIDSKGRVYKYGEFFPPELSPFCYNETIAQEYFPLTKEEALKQGYRWKDREERNYAIDIKNEEIPDNITEVKDDIVNKVIECEHKGNCNEQCTEAFKIIESELQFYRRMNLPLPHLCPNCRHYQRLKQRNPLKLWHRKCMREGCINEFETSYAPERKEMVYCERCYQQEVY